MFILQDVSDCPGGNKLISQKYRERIAHIIHLHPVPGIKDKIINGEYSSQTRESVKVTDMEKSRGTKTPLQEEREGARSFNRRV